jgi:hypothetical protein
VKLLDYPARRDCNRCPVFALFAVFRELDGEQGRLVLKVYPPEHLREFGINKSAPSVNVRLSHDVQAVLAGFHGNGRRGDADEVLTDFFLCRDEAHGALSGVRG